MLRFVPDHCKTQGTGNDIMRIIPKAIFLIPDHLKTQEMCIKAVQVDPQRLHYVSDHFKTQEICNKAVRDGPYALRFNPDLFVTQGQVKIWYDDNCNDDDELIEWYDSYEKHKAQKAEIKEDLIPVAWHPSRWWDWCVTEDEKKQTEKLWR